MIKLRNALCVLLSALALIPAGTAMAGQNDALFEQAASALLTPQAEDRQTGSCSLRPGDTLWVPTVAPEITPFDEQVQPPAPIATGTFESSDPSVVTVDATGLMTGVAEGTATVTCNTAAGETSFEVAVSPNAVPAKARAMVYVAQREFYMNKRAKLPKYNQYAKWYYGKKKEVGWCSVFTIWCANASGNNPQQEETVTSAADGDVVYFREGQVGNQYDGFSRLGRFVGIPRPGYLVIYGDLSNGYRATHIGIVTGVLDRGDGMYQVTTVEGNMSNTVKSYCYLYNSKIDNSTVGLEHGKRLTENMSALPAAEQTDPLVQYTPHTSHWCVFGFCASWK